MDPQEEYRDFDVVTETYHTVSGHPIQTDILIPKSASGGAHPVIIRIHGGFLFIGNRGSAWFPPYLLSYALSKNAIVVSPDYRLLPEAESGLEILDDICVRLWEWVHRELDGIVKRVKGEGVDLGRVLVTGESAGGYLATQLALSHTSSIKALIAVYPMIDLLSPFFLSGPRPLSPSEPYKVFGHSPPLSAFETHVVDVQAGRKPKIVTDGGLGGGDERFQMCAAAVLNGKLPSLLGLENAVCFPIERIEKDGEVRLPRRVWVYHGAKDHAVPVEGSQRFVGVVKEKLSEKGTEVRYYEDKEGDHGFDLGASLEREEWLREGLDWVEQAWLGDFA